MKKAESKTTATTKTNWIEEYNSDILTGKTIANNYIKSVVSMLLKGIESKKYDLDLEKANKAIKFIETFIYHDSGFTGRLILETWQKAIITAMFGILDPETGYRQFKEVFLTIGRKQGKSLFAGAIAVYTAYCDNEHGFEIYSFAPQMDQAEKSIGAAVYSIEKSKALSKRMKKRKYDWYFPELNGKMKIKAFNEKKSDGYNIHLAICDEMSSWPAVRGERQYEVISSGKTSRQQPIILSISSGGYVNGGPYDDLMNRSVKVLKGISSETRLLPFIYQIEDVEKWDDVQELRKALPNLGVSISVSDIQDLISVAKENYSTRVEFLAKYCNIKQSSVRGWLPVEIIKKCFLNPDVNESRMNKKFGTIGLDLSQVRDLSALAAVWQENNEVFALCHFWLPRDEIDEASKRDDVPYMEYVKKGVLSLCDGHLVSPDDIFDKLLEWVQKYNFRPLVVGYDRYSARELVNRIKGPEGGLQCDDVFQGDNLYPIIQKTEGLAKDGKLHLQSGNELLKVHFLGASIAMSKQRGRGKLEKADPKSHIDGVAAILDALTVMDKYYTQYNKLFENN